MSDNGAGSTREQALRVLRDNDKFLLTTHERPDGDAVGSLAAMQQVLTALGKDAVAFLTADEFPLPYEYRFIQLDGLVTEPPADLAERVMVFLDCGNIDRTPAAALEDSGRGILNVDHHHDNTRFGTLNHVDPLASCTAEMVWDLMKGLGVEATQRIAEALYVGVVTDTGRFMYENTGSRAHEMAAELIDGGIDVHAIYRRLYEGIPQGKLELLARGLTNVRALRRRPADGHPPHARGLPVDRRRRELLRGRRRPPALGRGHGGRRADPRPAGERRAEAQGVAAGDRRPRRRLAHRPRAGWRRPSPRGRLLDGPGLPGARPVPARRRWPISFERTASSSSTSPPA